MIGQNKSSGSFGSGYNPWLLRENYRGAKNETEGMKVFRFIKAMHFYQLYNIAVNRYKYRNLPKEIHPIVMEDYLVRDGLALLAFDDSIALKDVRTLSDGRQGAFVATQVRVEGELDLYGFGTDRIGFSFGAGGYEQRFGKENSVLMRDKPIPFPTILELEAYADKIANLWMTGDLNITALRMPFIGAGSEDDVKDLENIFKDVYSFAKFIKTRKNPVTGGEFTVHQTGVPVIFDKIEGQILQVKYAALGSLGIECTPRDKKERVQSAEVDADMGPVESYRNIGLDMRERSCEQFNDLFNPEDPLTVEYNSDLPSIVNGFINYSIVGGLTSGMKQTVSTMPAENNTNGGVNIDS